MSNILKITEMLLKRYDEKYDTYERNNLNDNINISSGDRYDFKKLILELRKTGLNKKLQIMILKKLISKRLIVKSYIIIIQTLQQI